MSEWISVKERLPPKSSDDWYNIVLTRRRDGKNIVRVGYWDGYHRMFYGFESPTNYDVTHWMPLPEPPKEEAPHEH